MFNLLRSRASVRHFTTGPVNGLAGAIGNTPLVSPTRGRRGGRLGVPTADSRMPDLPQRSVGEDRMQYIWEGRISESWWQRQR